MEGKSSQQQICSPRGRLDSLETDVNQLCDFRKLPAMLQENIVIKAAVTLRRSGESFGIVYAALAPVCKDWWEIVRDEQLIKEINEEAFFQDPLCRYLQIAQEVPIVGFQNNGYIDCIFAVGDILYTTECLDLDLPLRVFMYDIDDADVRHENLSRRGITFSNRRHLVIQGLNRHVALLVPKSDFLYAVECDDGDDAEAIIHKLHPDGTVVLCWNTHLLAHSVEIILFETPSDCMVLITKDQYVFGYSTVTGVSVGKGKLAFGNGPGIGFEYSSTVTSADVEKENIATFIRPRRGDIRWRNMAGSGSAYSILFKPLSMLIYREVRTFDGHGCFLHMSQSKLTLFDITSCTERDRELRSPNAKIFASSFHWFDKARGLIFCSRRETPSVLRITH